MTFSQALDALKAGKRVARAGWNGNGMWLLLIEGWTVDVEYETVLHGLLPIPWIGMKTVRDEFVPWGASQTDVLAKDWMEVTFG
jgi:hypothetical protein